MHEHEPADLSPAVPEKAYLMLPNDIIDPDTAASIALALGKDSAEYERAFDHRQPEQFRHRSTKTAVREGYNYTIPLGAAEHAPTDKLLFINKVKPLKRKPDMLRCQMTVVGFDEGGEEVVEGSWKQYFKKGDMVFAFGKDIEEHIEETHTGRKMAVAGMVVTIAGIAVAEEVYRRHHKSKKS